MHEMRRGEKRLDETMTRRVLVEGCYGVLSTVGEDGHPYGVPLTYVFDQGGIYFHSATEGHKLDNLRHCAKASFCVVGKARLLPEAFNMSYESVIAVGEVRELRGEEKLRALSLLATRLSPGFEDEGARYVEKAHAKTRAFRLDIEHLTGKGTSK